MPNQPPAITWITVPFTSLGLHQLHDMLRLRVDIFVVEQNCAYAEIDGKDTDCYHTLGLNEANEVVAAARIAPAGLIYSHVSIGRVVVRSDCRGTGLGYEVMEQAMHFCKSKLEAGSIKIAAQYHLEKFYKGFGFETISEVYPWDGIDHVDMLWQAQPNAGH